MKILDRLPVTGEPSFLHVPGGRLRIRPYQIVINVSISDVPARHHLTPNIPALLDSGNNHNFSIQELHLLKWAGIHPKALPFLKNMREGGRSPSLHSATVWIHRNQAGSRVLRTEYPVMLTLEEGIAIDPSDDSNYPRRPLLGVRAILKNGLKLVIDGKRQWVSLRSPSWW
jgi:hypothetical protein